MLNVTHETDGLRKLTLKLRGDLDAADSRRLRDYDLTTGEPGECESLYRVVGQFETIALDCQNLGFIDSSGLLVVLRLLKRSQETQKQLVLINPTRQFLNVLVLSQLRDCFTIEEADESFASV